MLRFERLKRSIVDLIFFTLISLKYLCRNLFSKVKIVTWNVNSIRARLLNVESFLTEHYPDVLLLQELKCEEQFFPETLLDLGYNSAIYGQKTYNGVAIISKHPIEDVNLGFNTFNDTQARYIDAFTGGYRVASVYVPNGQQIGCDAYRYKLEFLEHLYIKANNLLSNEEKLVIGGDFNIAPRDEDVHDPIKWQDEILCSLLEREAFFKIIHLGFIDAIKVASKDSKTPFTWWDYRKASFLKNGGLRIDHLLLSPGAADNLIETTVHTNERGKEKASDHAPVECIFN